VFGAMHISFGVLAVLLTTLVGLYWGIVFVQTRSVLAVSVSHMTLGVAAFHWFGLIR
jgi:membrane protease YdiL (CAAX protease family)